MNNCTFTGNLGKDARTSNVNGTPVANFSVAAKSGYGQNEQTIWLDCALWGKLAESGLIPYLTKGQQVCVSGELGTREHEGKTYLTLRLTGVDLMGGKGRTEDHQPSANGGNPSDDGFGDQDVPF
jgi:single-strand DNA-binding protein